MNATAVERITTSEDKPSTRNGQFPPASAGSFLMWGFFALVGIGVLVSVLFGLVQKWLWMRQLDYEGIFWTIFSMSGTLPMANISRQWKPMIVCN